MTGDSIITGSDDWTVREWSSSNGSCGSILTCHAGAITSVEYYASDKGIITGSCIRYSDGYIRTIFFEEKGECTNTRS
jgi:WD40 repeat protein